MADNIRISKIKGYSLDTTKKQEDKDKKNFQFKPVID